MNDIRRGMRWGAGVFGFMKAWRQNRRERRAEKRGERPADGADDFQRDEEDTWMVIDNGKRTTTNMTISGMLVWGVLKAVSTFFPDFPTEGLEELLAAIVAYVVGYITKSPAQPKVL